MLLIGIATLVMIGRSPELATMFSLEKATPIAAAPFEETFGPEVHKRTWRGVKKVSQIFRRGK